MSRHAGTPRTQSLARAIRLLHAIAERPAGSSASELARATALPRSTAARTLRTLADNTDGNAVDEDKNQRNNCKRNPEHNHQKSFYSVVSKNHQRKDRLRKIYEHLGEPAERFVDLKPGKSRVTS